MAFMRRSMLSILDSFLNADHSFQTSFSFKQIGARGNVRGSELKHRHTSVLSEKIPFLLVQFIYSALPSLYIYNVLRSRPTRNVLLIRLYIFEEYSVAYWIMLCNLL